MHVEERAFPFEPGQAVVFTPAPQQIAHSRPLPLTRAVVLRTSGERVIRNEYTEFRYQNEYVTVLPLEGGKPKRICAHNRNVVHAGWCAACELPAHQSHDGGLFCPRCERPAEAAPPPDLWIVRNWPEFTRYGPRRSAQALRTPHLTSRELWQLLSSIDSERRQAMEERFGLGIVARCMRFTERQNYTLNELADREDVEGFAAALARFQRPARALDALLALLGANEPDELPVPQLPPALLVVPADDRQPDASGQAPAWLRETLRKAA